ncbi:MAG: hypothetical protein CMQ40_12460 [Gammaproteobacteria bacterium]|nr:hypothetical protein [Gammaproteobacteria bacterium]
MNFKRNALSASVAVAAIAGASVAQAGTWLNGVTARSYSTELFGTGNATVISPTTAVYALAGGVATGSQVVDITLTGGTWGAALTSASLAFAATGGTGAATTAMVAGGATTDSTVQYRVSTTIALTSNDTFTLTYTIAGANALGTATTTGGPTLAFSIVDTIGNVDTPGAATVVATSADAITLSAATTASAPNIDVTNGSTQFTGGSTLAFDMGNFDITTTTGPKEDDGTSAFVINASDAVLSSATAVVTGDFSASLGVDADSNTTTNDGVTISGCLAANATTLTATTATFVLSSANAATIGNAATDCDLTMNVDGTTLIASQTPSLQLDLVYNGTGYADESLTASLTPMTKNGSNTTEQLLLNPTGAYDNFVRVTNGGTVAGVVFVTLINDAGDSVSFNFNDGASMAAGSSSALIPIADLYADAQAADATFDVGTGKLRAVFEGEFSGIDVQAVTVSTDGTTFATF